MADEELDAKAETAKRLGLKHGPRWTPKRGGWIAKQLTLFGTDHDQVIAKKLGRMLSAVRSQRTLRKIPAFSGSSGGGRTWTTEELALLGTDTDEAVAVSQKRAARNVPAFRDRRRRER